MASKTYVSIREGNAPLTLSVNASGGMYHARFDPYFTTSNTEIQQAIENDAQYGVDVDDSEKVFKEQDQEQEKYKVPSSEINDANEGAGGNDQNSVVPKTPAQPNKRSLKKPTNE